MKKEIFTYVTSPENNQRLDQYLFERYPDYSRSYFQKLIAQGMVHINGIPTGKPSYKLKLNDVINVSFAPIQEYKLTPQPIPLDIIFEHDDFLVINKPAGLLVHPASTTLADEKTLVGALLHHFNEFMEFADDQRPGIVHRLDKDTSGLILIARTPQAQITLSNMFKNRSMQKTYLAIVRGEPPQQGTIDYPIGRHPHVRHKMSHMGVANRDATTHYQTNTYYDGYALVEALPITGRTHQIRVHFAAIGHGLLGDNVYGLQSKLIKRQALHAYKLSFMYKDQQFDFQAPIPADFYPLIKNDQTEV